MAGATHSAREGGENPPRTRRRNGWRAALRNPNLRSHWMLQAQDLGRQIRTPEVGRPAFAMHRSLANRDPDVSRLPVQIPNEDSTMHHAM